MSSRRKLKEEEGQTKLKGLIKVNSPNRSAKQWTPPSAEKPIPKRINMLNVTENDQHSEIPEGSPKPTPGPPMNPLVFDLTAMEQ